MMLFNVELLSNNQNYTGLIMKNNVLANLALTTPDPKSDDSGDDDGDKGSKDGGSVGS